MSKRGPSIPSQCLIARLMMPIFGLASRIHATVKRMLGMMSGMSDSAKKNVLKGVFVRSFIHARPVPTRNEKVEVPSA